MSSVDVISGSAKTRSAGAIATASRSALEAALPAPSEIRRFIGETLRIVMDTTWSDAAGMRAATKPPTSMPRAPHSM